MDEEFLLDSDAARRLYHTDAEPMPIADYHCHIDARTILRTGDLRILPRRGWAGIIISGG